MAETTIDQISEEKGNVVLLLRQVAPWEDRMAMVEFQRRLNGYIEIVSQGALYEKYPDLKERPVLIRLLCRYQPSGDMEPKLARVRSVLAGLGVGFEIIRIDVVTSAERKDPLKNFIVSLFARLCGKKS